MNDFDFSVRLTIVSAPTRIWEMKVGEKFCLNASCYNNVTKRYEVYLKVSRTQCVLDSHPDKPQLSIPALVGSIAKADGYRVIDEYRLPE